MLLRGIYKNLETIELDRIFLRIISLLSHNCPSSKHLLKLSMSTLESGDVVYIYIYCVQVEILYKLQLVQEICTSCNLYKQFVQVATRTG